MNDFGCNRHHIESLASSIQRNVLVHEYCSKRFSFTNAVDLYYRRFDGNAILMMIFVIVLMPVLFTTMGLLAEKFLADGVQSLTKRFKISQAVAAVTLLAFAGGAPDILASLANTSEQEGSSAVIGIGMSVYIFGCTMILSIVVFNIKNGILAFPRRAVLKELLFSIAVVVLIIAFGLFQSQGYLLIVTLIFLYAAYIFATLFISKQNESEETSIAFDEEVESRTVSSISDPAKDIANKDSRSDSIIQPPPSKGIEINIGDIDLANIESLHKLSYFGAILEELLESEEKESFNILSLAINACGMITIPYLKNPLMKGAGMYIPLAMATVLILNRFEIGDLGILGYSVSAFAVVLIFFVLDILKMDRYVLETSWDVLSIFATLAWIDLCANLIVDMIAFLAFYFSINELILCSVLLSFGNSIGELFTAAALTKKGAGIMAALSVYSSQFLSLIATLIINSWKSLGRKSKGAFDIFYVNWFSLPEAEREPYPASGLFIIIVIASTLCILLLQLFYLMHKNFTIDKAFSKVLVGIYVAFFAGSMVLSHYSWG